MTWGRCPQAGAELFARVERKARGLSDKKKTYRGARMVMAGLAKGRALMLPQERGPRLARHTRLPLPVAIWLQRQFIAAG